MPANLIALAFHTCIIAYFRRERKENKSIGITRFIRHKCLGNLLFQWVPPVSVVFFARKTEYFNEIRRNNSKQSQYYVKFTENEKKKKKNIF